MSEWNDESFNSIYVDGAKKEYSPEDRAKFIPVMDRLMQKAPSIAKFLDEDLAAVQQNFHNLIRYRCRRVEAIQKWLTDEKDSLPIITNELLTEQEPQWISIPGMYGGFSYGLFESEGKPILVTDSWIRIVGGSGEQHEITPEKVELVAVGFA